MANGGPWPSRRQRAKRFPTVATMAESSSRSEPSARLQSILIGDLELKLVGLVDPARHELLRRQESNEFFFLVGLRHRAGKVFRLAIAQLPHGIDADFSQEADV